jgi:hypothetical protein
MRARDSLEWKVANCAKRAMSTLDKQEWNGAVASQTLVLDIFYFIKARLL